MINYSGVLGYPFSDKPYWELFGLNKCFNMFQLFSVVDINIPLI